MSKIAQAQAQAQPQSPTKKIAQVQAQRQTPRKKSKRKGPRKIKKGKYVTIDYLGIDPPDIKETAYGTFTFPGKRVIRQSSQSTRLPKRVNEFGHPADVIAGYFFMANGKIIRRVGYWDSMCALAGSLDYPNFLGAEFYRINRRTFYEADYIPTDDEFEDFVRSIPKAYQKYLHRTDHTK